MGFDSAGTLLKETIRLLREQRKPILDLHKETGIPFHWLAKFKAGTYKNPSVNRTQFLYEFLSGSPLLNANEHTGRAA